MRCWGNQEDVSSWQRAVCLIMPLLLSCTPGRFENYYGTLNGPLYYPDEPFKSYLGCACGMFQVTQDGGDAGYSYNFPISDSCALLRFLAQGTRGGQVNDRIEVRSNGGSTILWSSDCNNTDFNSGWISIPAGTTDISLIVYALCSGGSGTYWYVNLSIFCLT